MERYGKYMVYTHEEVLDKHFGPKGTPRRDAFDAAVEKDVLEYFARQEAEREKEAVHKALFADVEELEAVMA